MTDAPTLELAGIVQRFDTTIALDEFTLTIPSGTIGMLLGPNGAGKTTVVRIATGALTPTGGRVRTFGLDPQRDGETIRRRCGVVPARPALYDRLSGLDNLGYAAALWDVARPDAAISLAADRFAITDALDRRVGTYSTGMRARLALARATLHNPDFLLLDEPTAGLDPESSRTVLALIRELCNAGTTVLMCTHLLSEAEGLADHVTVMDTGRVLAAGPPATLIRDLWRATTVIIDAEDRTQLDGLALHPNVVSYRRDESDAGAIVEIDDLTRVPSIIDELVGRGARLTRVEPRPPTLEELYFAIRSGPKVDTARTRHELEAA